jgi:hypothetical protein
MSATAVTCFLSFNQWRRCKSRARNRHYLQLGGSQPEIAIAPKSRDVPDNVRLVSMNAQPVASTLIDPAVPRQLFLSS